MKIKTLLGLLIVCAVVVGFSLSQRKSDTTETKADTDKPVETASKADSALPETKPASASEPKAAIKWHSYNDGLALGKDKKKKIFLNFYADWCGYCKQMDSKTFADKSVISYMNENFVPVRVNADKDLKLAATYEVRGLPVSWFLSETGEAIGSQPGYVPPEMMLPILKYIRTDSYKQMSFDKFGK